jgi:predicted neuraminidase
MSLQVRYLGVGLVLLACLPQALQWRKEREADAHRKFVVAPAKTRTGETPFFKSDFITADPVVPSVHAASITEGSDGTLYAAWYGGSHEGARDVNIFWSRRAANPDSAWSKPEVLVSRATAAQELQRPIKKVGNAVLFADGRGALDLIYVTVSFGGWSTSSLNVKTSRDEGKTWLPSQRLTLSPFLNLSELVKNKPCALSDGEWAVPIYHECLGKFPEILWLRDGADGRLSWSKTRVCGGRSLLQPALVPLDPNNALLFCRDFSSRRKLHLSRSADLGQHWSTPKPLTLPNPDSGLDAIRLLDGRILLAFNDVERGRENLRLAISTDEGATWTRRATLESEAGEEFSYPSLIQTRSGIIHVVYTWKRKGIKHAAFNEAWLDAKERP